MNFNTFCPSPKYMYSNNTTYPFSVSFVSFPDSLIPWLDMRDFTSDSRDFNCVPISVKA